MALLFPCRVGDPFDVGVGEVRRALIVVFARVSCGEVWTRVMTPGLSAGLRIDRFGLRGEEEEVVVVVKGEESVVADEILALV